MKIIRKIILFVSGILALRYLVGVFLDMVTFHWRAIPWALLQMAGWTAVCVYLILLDRQGAAPSSEGS